MRIKEIENRSTAEPHGIGIPGKNHAIYRLNARSIDGRLREGPGPEIGSEWRGWAGRWPESCWHCLVFAGSRAADRQVYSQVRGPSSALFHFNHRRLGSRTRKAQQRPHFSNQFHVCTKSNSKLLSVLVFPCASKSNKLIMESVLGIVCVQTASN